PVDGSPTSNLGLSEAIKLGKLTGARLLLLHAVDIAAVSVTPEAGAAMPALFDAMRAAGKDILARARATADTAGVTVETVLVDTLAGRGSGPAGAQAQNWGRALVA